MFNIYEIFLFLFPSASKGCDISRAYLSSPGRCHRHGKSRDRSAKVLNVPGGGYAERCMGPQAYGGGAE